MDLAAHVALSLIVAFAFAVEASLGFGATLLTVSLGTRFVPLPELLPMFVPVNMVVSAYIVLRDRRRLEPGRLARDVLPWMVVGIPLGLLAFRSVDGAVLTRVLGVVVIAFAAREGYALWRRRPVPAPSGNVARAILIVGGAVHGAFGAGGPFVVWVLGRSGMSKETFRASLSLLWLTLNTILLTTWAAEGRLGWSSLGGVGAIGLGALAGVVVGNALFRRIPAERFRIGVYVLLAIVGMSLARPWAV